MTDRVPVSPSVPDRCSAPYRVRFDESAPDGRIRTSALLRYAQDLAWFHSGQRGFDRAWYRERGLAWLARAAEIAVLSPLGVGDELTGTTQVVGWRRVWARRRTEFTDAAGSLAAWTHVDWVLIDARGAPVRVPDSFTVFGASDATFPLGRVALAEPPHDGANAGITVRPQELDPMDHVNNAVYADWLDERVIAAGGAAGAAATRAVPRIVRLEYARAAEPGTTLSATTWRDDEGVGWSCRIAMPDGADALRARLEPLPAADEV